MFAPLLPPLSLPQPSTLPHPIPILPQLTHDEIVLQHRKSHIRSFGSRWLLPPGISKTLQGLADEQAERAEAEAAAAAQEAQAQREEEMAMMQHEEGEEAEGNGEGIGMEEDLDREVVDMDEEGAEALSEGDMDSEDGDEDDDEAQWADSPSSLPLQSMGSQANPHLPNRGPDTDIDIMAVDLDGDIPSAVEDDGSYQHTDTDVEDESSTMFSATDHVGADRHGNVLESSVFGREVPSPVARRVVDAGEMMGSQSSSSAAVAAREAAARRASGRRGEGRENLRGSFG